MPNYYILLNFYSQATSETDRPAIESGVTTAAVNRAFEQEVMKFMKLESYSKEAVIERTLEWMTSLDHFSVIRQETNESNYQEILDGLLSDVDLMFSQEVRDALKPVSSWNQFGTVITQLSQTLHANLGKLAVLKKAQSELTENRQIYSRYLLFSNTMLEPTNLNQDIIDIIISYDEQFYRAVA